MNPINYFAKRREYLRNLEQRRSRMHRVAYSWCQNKALADDLVQDALTKAFKNLNQLREVKALDKWMFDILTNCWRDHLRSQKVRKLDDLDNYLDHEKLIHEDRQDRGEIIKRVRNAVSRLPVGQREVLALVDLEGFSYPEVAEILGIPLGTVTSRIARGRSSLKTMLKEYNINTKNNVVTLPKPKVKLEI